MLLLVTVGNEHPQDLCDLWWHFVNITLLKGRVTQKGSVQIS